MSALPRLNEPPDADAARAASAQIPVGHPLSESTCALVATRGSRLSTSQFLGYQASQPLATPDRTTMGVPGLWDVSLCLPPPAYSTHLNILIAISHIQVLRPAGEVRSLTHLSVKEGFEANSAGKRGLRVGIDASIWFYHATTVGRQGENPEIRTLFFRCTRLMSLPFLPLFVFDGPKRPEIKRGRRISGKNHWMVQGMQEIIAAFGFEWRMASGASSLPFYKTCTS